MNKYKNAFKSISDNQYQYGTDEQWELLQELVDKEDPKKPKDLLFDSHGYYNFICPNCNGMHTTKYQRRYCCGCGQKLDWSDKNEKSN